MSLVGLALGSVVKARASALGFDRVAIGPAEPPEHGAALEAWLDAGYAGTMGYLDRGRADPAEPRPGGEIALEHRARVDGGPARDVAARGRPDELPELDQARPDHVVVVAAARVA